MHYGRGFINISETKSDDKILSQTNSIVFINDKKITNKTFNTKEFY